MKPYEAPSEDISNNIRDDEEENHVIEHEWGNDVEWNADMVEGQDP